MLVFCWGVFFWELGFCDVGIFGWDNFCLLLFVFDVKFCVGMGMVELMEWEIIVWNEGNGGSCCLELGFFFDIKLCVGRGFVELFWEIKGFVVRFVICVGVLVILILGDGVDLFLVINFVILFFECFCWVGGDVSGVVVCDGNVRLLVLLFFVFCCVVFWVDLLIVLKMFERFKFSFFF